MKLYGIISYFNKEKLNILISCICYKILDYLYSIIENNDELSTGSKTQVVVEEINNRVQSKLISIDELNIEQQELEEQEISLEDFT